MTEEPLSPRPPSWTKALVADGRLPARYGRSIEQDFKSRVRVAMSASSTVLDFGSGRDPAIPRRERPAGVTYFGLDVSRDELEAAPANSYDEVVVADVSQPVPELVGRFDLVISWQVLEHVRAIDSALENLRRYLKPSGVLVSLLSGRFAAFAIANRLMPDRLSQAVAHRVLNVEAHDVFPASYDRCYASALRRLLSHWRHVEVAPVYRGAVYFRFSRPLLAAYVRYENWLERAGHDNFATHYIVEARP